MTNGHNQPNGEAMPSDNLLPLHGARRPGGPTRSDPLLAIVRAFEREKARLDADDDADDEFFGVLHDWLTYRTPICTSREGAMAGMKLALTEMDHGIGALPGAVIASVNRFFVAVGEA